MGVEAPPTELLPSGDTAVSVVEGVHGVRGAKVGPWRRRMGLFVSGRPSSGNAGRGSKSRSMSPVEKEIGPQTQKATEGIEQNAKKE